VNQLWRTILDADPYWHIGAWALLVAGITLLLWALFRDKPGWFGVPRERCPRCRYDMAGTQGERGFTCPECGRVSRTRRPFRKTRRRWGFAALALLMLLGRYVAVHKERVCVHGWHELIPTTVAVLWIDPERWFKSEYGYAPSISIGDRWSDRVLERIRFRLVIGTGWQRDLWLRRLGPMFDTQGRYPASPVVPWAVYRIGGRFEYEIIPVPSSSPGSICFGSLVHGKMISYEFQYATAGLPQLIQELINIEDWVDYGGRSQWLFWLGDRLVVFAPQNTLDEIERLLDFLECPSRMPESKNESCRIDSKWVIRFPLAELLRVPLAESPATRPTSGPFAYDKLEGRAALAIEMLVDEENWFNFGGDQHWSMIVHDECIVISPKDIRQDLIDAAHKIAEHGPEYWIERINAEHED